MDSLLDALIGEELDSLGEELSAFLDPTCACGPVVPSARGSGQPTRKKRKKQRKRAQHAREDKQEVRSERGSENFM